MKQIIKSQPFYHLKAPADGKSENLSGNGFSLQEFAKPYRKREKLSGKPRIFREFTKP